MSAPITVFFSSIAIFDLATIPHCTIGRVFAHACVFGGDAIAFMRGL